MSKLSFRARALDASKPMPIYMAEELPDLPDYSAINRAVPQMPSGMEKEEECEHHLQRAICAGLIIPTPEVTDIKDVDAYEKLYPANYKQPRQLIHMQPFAMEQDIIDYDMDSEDERWLMSQTQRLELSPLKFEEMMDRLEKSIGQTVVTLTDAKALFKEDDDLIIAVFDYWLNKRLKTQHPLILTVKTEHRGGIAMNNPYLAFRRRTEKMQTRKNRKNDESSYEKMLKLRRDLSRAVTLLELVKRREKIKREYVHLTVEVLEKRYQAKDFSGAIITEVSAIKASRPAFTPIFHNHYPNQSWSNKAIIKDDVIPRKDKRQYKKRKHKSSHHRVGALGSSGLEGLGSLSSDEEALPRASPEPEDLEEEGQFAFRRNKLCTYHMPLPNEGNWPWCSKEENGSADKKYRFTLASLSNPKRCIGFARRRVGRGGRIILDRIGTNLDEFWKTVDFTIYEPDNNSTERSNKNLIKVDSADSSTNFFNNTELSSVLSNNVKSVRTDFKSEIGYNNESARTSIEQESGENKNVIKQEPEEVNEEWSIPEPSTNTENEVHTPEEQFEMVEFLKEVRKDWLHFRPKTPAPDYEPPCHLLPADDYTFIPSANTPFAVEIQTLEAPSTLLDTSTFITTPFTLEDLFLESVDVPITDTRQINDVNVQTGINLNVNVGLNTLTSNVSNSYTSDPNRNDSFTITDELNNINNCEDYRTIGCSKFHVSDISASASLPAKKHQIVSSTLVSSKINCVNVASDGRTRPSPVSSNVNGLLPQFGYDVTGNDRTKNNKQSYAYLSAASGSNTSTSTLSLRTSAHTLNTLNSHSANILEIPMPNDTDGITNKVNSQCSDSSTAPPNNKNKTIVQKNNIIMEVT